MVFHRTVGWVANAVNKLQLLPKHLCHEQYYDPSNPHPFVEDLTLRWIRIPQFTWSPVHHAWHTGKYSAWHTDCSLYWRNEHMNDIVENSDQ